jgi:hypothetical protein
MLIWSRFLYGVACLVGVVCLVTSNVGIGIVAAIVMIVALWLRSTALDVALERANDDAVFLLAEVEDARNVGAQYLSRHDAAVLELERERRARIETEGTLIKVTALWSRSIRSTTAPKYSTRILALRGESAALAAAVMLSRAAADGLTLASGGTVHGPGTSTFDIVPLPFVDVDAVDPEHDGASDAVPPTPAPDPSPWSLVPAWVWRTVAGAVVFAAGLFVWEVLV